VNVLRATHRALVPGGKLLDFHPIAPPWARVTAAGKTLGHLEEPDFLAQLRAAEDGLREVVRQRLFRRVAVRTREIVEYYDDADELLDAWEDVVVPELERRLRATRGPVHVVEKVKFGLYQTLER
jgi:hypothetical protein